MTPKTIQSGQHYHLVDLEAEIKGDCWFTNGKNVFHNKVDLDAYIGLWKIIASIQAKELNMVGVPMLPHEADEKLKALVLEDNALLINSDLTEGEKYERLQGLAKGYKANTNVYSKENMIHFNFWIIQNRWQKPLLRGSEIFWHRTDAEQETKTTQELLKLYLSSIKPKWEFVPVMEEVSLSNHSGFNMKSMSSEIILKLKINPCPNWDDGMVEGKYEKVK